MRGTQAGLLPTAWKTLLEEATPPSFSAGAPSPSVLGAGPHADISIMLYRFHFSGGETEF